MSRSAEDEPVLKHRVSQGQEIVDHIFTGATTAKIEANNTAIVDTERAELGLPAHTTTDCVSC